MSRIRNIYDLKNRPVGQTKLGKLFVALIAFVAIITLIANIADEVMDGDSNVFDQAILFGINSFSHPTFDIVMLFVTSLGNISTVVTVTFLTLLLFAYHKKWQAVVQIVFGIGGATLLNYALKLIYARDRPQLWTLLTHESTYSFPSGHAAVTAAAAATAILLSWHTKFRYYVVAIGSILTLVVGFSRLYLGVHYPTDVLAGWLVGTGWVIMVATILGAFKLPLWYTKSNG